MMPEKYVIPAALSDVHPSLGQLFKIRPEPIRALRAILHVNINDVDPVNLTRRAANS
jgi:hypothetical protein